MSIKDPVQRREYHAKYMKEVWYPANKKKHIEMVHRGRKQRQYALHIEVDKRKVQCKYCPESCTACLDFHHRDSKQKKDSISNMIRDDYSLEAILKEIEKCDVVCANCHRKLHHNIPVAGWSSPVSSSAS